ncbi:MAG: hypothetical protein KDA72_12935 [Planctomycetales bacterium]|nr:hypothetical protein [Planctomycetales bacterium]
MLDWQIVLLVFATWIVLNRWLLPALGIQTCMSGQCAVRPTIKTEPPADSNSADPS